MLLLLFAFQLYHFQSGRVDVHYSFTVVILVRNFRCIVVNVVIRLAIETSVCFVSEVTYTHNDLSWDVKPHFSFTSDCLVAYICRKIRVSQVKPSNFQTPRKITFYLPVWHKSFILHDVKLAELSNNSLNKRMWHFRGSKHTLTLIHIFRGLGPQPPWSRLCVCLSVWNDDASNLSVEAIVLVRHRSTLRCCCCCCRSNQRRLMELLMRAIHQQTNLSLTNHTHPIGSQTDRQDTQYRTTLAHSEIHRRRHNISSIAD